MEKGRAWRKGKKGEKEEVRKGRYVKQRTKR